MGRRLIIHRTGEARYERAVKITDRDGGSWYVDPQEMVLRITGVFAERTGCIISFARGLQDAGYEVVMDAAFIGQQKSYRIFTHSSHPTVCVYYVIGLAWGLGKWHNVVQALQNKVAKPHRFAVLEETGRYYLQNPFRAYGSMSIVVPV